MILAIDTATDVAVVALGTVDGELVAVDRWTAGYRHGEELLSRIERLLEGAGIGRAGLTAIGVGTGPGAFTGLRVGLATAKGLAHGLRLPIVGIATSTALIASARSASARSASARSADVEGPLVLIGAAGPNDRVVTVSPAPGIEAAHRRVVGDEAFDGPAGATVVAIDLAGRADAAAVERGIVARDGLAAALVGLAAARLAAGATDDLATLVPEYVTLPRGLAREGGAVVIAGR